MGCTASVSEEDKAARAAAKAEKQKKELEKDDFRVLLLGTSQSGKSTFTRQMKVLFASGFAEDELGMFKEAAVASIVLGLRSCIDYCAENQVKIGEADAVKFFQEQEPWSTRNQTELALVFENSKAVWGEDTVKKAAQALQTAKGSQESFLYAMANLDRISKPNWIPTNEDCLYTRQRTSGFSEILFGVRKSRILPNLVGDNIWVVIDVGGQRIERRKWIHTKGMDVSALIFFCALDDFNVPSEEELGKTKLEESISVWAEVINGKLLGKIPVILFLNKTDLFKKKIETTSLAEQFKDFKGGNDYKKSISYIKNLYLKQVNPDLSIVAPEKINVQETCAVSTDNIKFVFEAVRKFVLQEILDTTGLSTIMDI